MPFLVLRCYACHTFQVQQQKKVNKFVCKMCGEKQSVMKVIASSDNSKGLFTMSIFKQIYAHIYIILFILLLKKRLNKNSSRVEHETRKSKRRIRRRL